MRIALLAATAAAALAFAAPAMAQDDPETSFSGPRAEAVVGWDRIEDGSIYAPSRDGVVYGGAVGYDVQRGGTVFGVEGEITGSTARDTHHGVLAAGDRLRESAGRDLYVGGRLGFTAGSRALIYAKGGYTNANANAKYSLGTTETETSTNLEGWRAGAGAEIKLSGNIYAKAEYRYSRLEDDADNAVKRHQVVGGLGVRF